VTPDSSGALSEGSGALPKTSGALPEGRDIASSPGALPRCRGGSPETTMALRGTAESVVARRRLSGNDNGSPGTTTALRSTAEPLWESPERLCRLRKVFVLHGGPSSTAAELWRAAKGRWFLRSGFGVPGKASAALQRHFTV
jgi:hypothetical protein